MRRLPPRHRDATPQQHPLTRPTADCTWLGWAHQPATALTHRTGLTAADHHPQRPVHGIVDPHQIHLTQTYQQLTHERRDQLPKGSSRLGCHLSQPIMEDPPSLPADSNSPRQNPILPTHSRRALIVRVRPPTLVPGTADRVGWPLALLGLGWLAGFGCLCSGAALYDLGAGGDGGVDDCPDWVGVVCLVEASDFPLVRGGLGVDHAEFFEDADLPGQSTPP